MSGLASVLSGFSCVRNDAVEASLDFELALALQHAEAAACDDPNLLHAAVANNFIPASEGQPSLPNVPTSADESAHESSEEEQQQQDSSPARRLRSESPYSPPPPSEVNSGDRRIVRAIRRVSYPESPQSAVVYGPQPRRSMNVPMPRFVFRGNNNATPNNTTNANNNTQEDPWDTMSPEQIMQVTDRVGDVKVELGAETKDQLEVKKKDENQEVYCTICRFECETGDSLRTLPCGHQFHEDCVDQWFKFKTFCPMCMKDVRDFFPSKDATKAPPCCPTASSTVDEGAQIV